MKKRLDDRISDQRAGVSRRTILRGTAGIALTLPLLETFVPRRVMAEQGAGPHYLLLCHQANGVAQGDPGIGEPDLWWPQSPGVITPESLSSQSTQATSVLSEYADRMLLVSGVDARFPDGYDSHTGSAAFHFTAANLVGSDDLRPEAANESIDTYVANQLTPGDSPLHIQVGGPDWNHTSISWVEANAPRPIDKNPYNIYLRLFADRAYGDSVDDEAQQRMLQAKASVVDHVREELNALRAMNLSKADNENLEQHLASIRDLELKMESLACTELDADVVTRLNMVSNDDASRDTFRDEVADLHARLVALAFACDDHRTAAVRFGNIADGAYYVVEGGAQHPYNYHSISHRKDDQNGGNGSDIGNGLTLHHEVDRVCLTQFGLFLKYIAERTAPNGNSLLDESVCVMTNSLGFGRMHSEGNVPFCIVGSGGGFFKQGQYLNLRSTPGLNEAMGSEGGVSLNQMLNTLINAAGVRNPNGTLVDNFGTGPMNQPGVLSELMA